MSCTRRSVLMCVLVAAVVLSAPGLLGNAPSFGTVSPAAGLCFGQKPTIVGTPGEELAGTEGPDVVDTNGAINVTTLEGDDLLCVTGEASEEDVSTVGCLTLDSGPGDDRIDASGGLLPCSPTIFPGAGRDEIRAARPLVPGKEALGVSVYAHQETIHSNEAAGDADLIITGDGPDSVEAGVQDVVHLAGGNDGLVATNEGASSGGVWDGGTGDNNMVLTLWPPFYHQNRVHHWLLDNRQGRLVRDGDTVATIHGFTRYDQHVQGPFRFLGSDQPEIVADVTLDPEHPLGFKVKHWPIVLDMGGGDDVMLYFRGGARSRFDGGDGIDRFSFAAGLNPNYREAEPIKGFLDLATGQLRYSRVNRPAVRTRVVGFENVRWWSGADAVIKGTDGPNLIVARRQQPNRAITVDGRAGDDVIKGGWGDDVLVGGAGADEVDGREGQDRCSSEVRINCEP